MTEDKFWKLQRTLSWEFDRYLLANPESDLANKIPADAQVVFLLNDNSEFNNLSIKYAKKQRENGQRQVFIKIDRLLPEVSSRIVNPHLEKVSI